MLKNLSLLVKLFFLIIFFYIISKIEFEKLQLNYNNINILIATVFFLGFHLLRAFKLGLILKLGNKNSIQIYFIGFFLGFISPGRLGDLLKVFYIKKKNKFKCFKQIIIDKLIDLYWISIFSFISILYLIKIDFYIIIFVFLTSLLINFLLLNLLKKKFMLSSNLGSFIFINNYSILSLIFYSIGCYFVLKIFINDFSLYYTAVFILALGVTILPISFNGLGSREMVMIYYFTNLNFGYENIISISFTIFILLNFFYSLIGSIYYFNSKKVNLDKKLIIKFKNNIFKNISRIKN